MRTTLTLDPDVMRLLEDEVHRTRKPLKQVVNDAVRRGLSPRPAAQVSPQYRVRPHVSKLMPGVDHERLNALVDQLEDDAVSSRFTSSAAERRRK